MGTTKHGWTKTRFFNIWTGIIFRCKHDEYYKSRGLSKRWRIFTNFLADMYDSYDEHVRTHGQGETTIDRIDNSKGYSKSNCRWATWKIQNTNKPSVQILTHKGETLTVRDWAKKLGIHHSTLQYRLKKWPTGKALSLPAQH